MTLESFANQFKTGFSAAREFGNPRSTTIEQPPFPVTTKQELLNKFDSLKKNMRFERIDMEEASLMLLEENIPWRISPESNIARLHAIQYQLGKFEKKQQDSNPDCWRELIPIHHESAIKSATNMWKNQKDLILELEKNYNQDSYNQSTYTTKRLFNQLTNNKKHLIDAVQAEISEKNPKLNAEIARQRAVDQVIGNPFIKSNSHRIKSTRAYYHGKRLSSRAAMGEEILKVNQDITTELPKSSLKIGFVGGKFFEMILIKNIKINPVTGEESWMPQGLLFQEPNLNDADRKTKPSGILVLPWARETRTDAYGKIYVNIAIRNEPGADSFVTATTGEQTSISKLSGIDPREEPGKAHLAVCIQENLAVNCEGVPELAAMLPSDFVATRGGRDGNRVGGGHNGYGIVRVDENSPLLSLYKDNNWVELDVLQEIIEESAKGEVFASEYLLANLSLLYAHLRKEDKARIKNLDQTLQEIASNPATRLGWMMGGLINDLVRLTK